MQSGRGAVPVAVRKSGREGGDLARRVCHRTGAKVGSCKSKLSAHKTQQWTGGSVDREEKASGEHLARGLTILGMVASHTGVPAFESWLHF